MKKEEKKKKLQSKIKQFKNSLKRNYEEWDIEDIPLLKKGYSIRYITTYRVKKQIRWGGEIQYVDQKIKVMGENILPRYIILKNKFIERTYPRQKCTFSCQVKNILKLYVMIPDYMQKSETYTPEVFQTMELLYKLHKQGKLKVIKK